MTHDELLALLNAKSDSDEVHALRAVVELHKPIGFSSTSGLPPECNVCRAEPYYSNNEVYPCSTIQAIEKELA